MKLYAEQKHARDETHGYLLTLLKPGNHATFLSVLSISFRARAFTDELLHQLRYILLRTMWLMPGGSLAYSS